VVAWTIVSASGGWACGQVPAGWKPPPETIVVDFNTPHADRRLVLLDDGMAIEVPGRLLMVQHHRVRIEAPLPEPGTCKFLLHSPDAQVGIRPHPVQGRRAATDAVSKLKALGPEELKERVRQVIDGVLGPIEKEVRAQVASLGCSQYRKYLDENAIALPPAKTKEAEERLLRETYITARTVELAQPNWSTSTSRAWVWRSRPTGPISAIGLPPGRLPCTCCSAARPRPARPRRRPSPRD
jgi:hypothetical protein